MLTPVSYIVRTTMSNEMLRVPTRKQARLHASIARFAATALRSMHGICTSPQIGSQVSPSWCSMAAAALCYLMGKTINETEYAAEIAMEHQLGLTCDPICGLVQIPCIERNAVAAKRAIDAFNLSSLLCGSRNISFDMVVRTMKETGVHISSKYRETSEGGLARLYNRRRA